MHTAAHGVVGSELSTAMTEAKYSERTALVQAILDLGQDQDEVLEDAGLAHALAQYLKPDIDRLAALKSDAAESFAELELEFIKLNKL